MTHRELRARMDSYELMEWGALFAIEPWGDVRADLRAALIARTIVSVFGAKNAKLTDFLLNFDRKPDTPKTPEESVDYIAELNKQLGGLDLRATKETVQE